MWRTNVVAAFLVLAGCVGSPAAEPKEVLSPISPQPNNATVDISQPRSTHGTPAGLPENGNVSAPDSRTNVSANRSVPGPLPVWADPANAHLYPGIMLANGCTTNFLFTSLDNHHIYFGSAAHCFGLDSCNPASEAPLPPGSPVSFLNDNATYVRALTGMSNATTWTVGINGTLAYNSWHTMLATGEDDDLVCGFNDFALIEVPLLQQGRITPYFREFGAPTKILGHDEIPLLAPVVTYGHSPYWLGQEQLQAKRGFVSEAPRDDMDKWYFLGAQATPTFFGDSGAAAIVGESGAAGIVRSIALTPTPETPFGQGTLPGPGTTLFVTLAKVLEYLHTHSEIRVQLAVP